MSSYQMTHALRVRVDIHESKKELNCFSHFKLDQLIEVYNVSDLFPDCNCLLDLAYLLLHLQGAFGTTPSYAALYCKTLKSLE